MQRKLKRCSLMAATMAVWGLILPGLLQAQSRMMQAMEKAETRQLAGSLHPLAKARYDQGHAAGEMMLHRMVLTFKPNAAQQADLDALLLEQQNPLSPYYHQWLTPQQYAQRFGLNASDLAGVAQWLEERGFTVDEIARSRTYLAFSGTASQVKSVFGTQIDRFLVNGQMHYANVSEPSLPGPLANVVLAFHGLNNFRPKPRAVAARRTPQPRFTSNISGNHFLAPDDFATIYNVRPLYNMGIDGTGQSLAVMGQTDLVMSDIASFRSAAGLSAKTPTVRLVPGAADPGVVKDDLLEADLDVEWAGAVARNADLIYVNSNNAFGSLQYAVSANLAPVLSTSYGDCEQNFSAGEIATLTSLGQQANAQGQTIVGPSGDTGAADCDYPPNASTQVTSASHGLAVDIPASLPYVTGVGGTTFNEGTGDFWSAANNPANGSAQSYIPEVAWNATASQISSGGSLSSSGGGVSKLFAKPAWQTGPGVPADGQRDVPDISLAGAFDHDGYLICSGGSCVNGFRASDNSLFVVGGTSAGAPVFAGVLALLNQQMQGAQGNVNPRLYELAATSQDAFHDITSGDNKVPCTAGSPDCPSGTTQIGFAAGPGYDLATGLGSVDAFNLVTEFSTSAAPATADFQLSLFDSSLTLTAGTTGNAATTTLVLSSLHGFKGAVTLSCTVASLPGTTCSVSPGSLNTSGSATVTITAPTQRAAFGSQPKWPRFLPWTDGSLALAMGLVIAGKNNRFSQHGRGAMIAFLVLMLFALMVGCGGGGTSTTSAHAGSTTGSATGTGVVTVQGASANTTHSVSIVVTVN